jgi:hypothetical protein
MLSDASQLSVQEYKPERLSRRGELFAWLSAGIAAAGWLVYRLQGELRIPGLPWLVGFLLLAAAGISLANWIDRHTRLKIGANGLTFSNGMQHITLAWQEIEQLEVYPSRFGDRVKVLGTRQFNFRLYKEVAVAGEVKGRMGFKEGELIVAKIVERAQLSQVESEDSVITYARKRS